MLVKIDYSTAPRYPSKRRDLQATKLFLVTVRHNQVLRVDHEVAALEWQCLSALQKELNDQFHAVSAGWCTAELAVIVKGILHPTGTSLSLFSISIYIFLNHTQYCNAFLPITLLPLHVS